MMLLLMVMLHLFLQEHILLLQEEYDVLLSAFLLSKLFGKRCATVGSPSMKVHRTLCICHMVSMEFCFYFHALVVLSTTSVVIWQNTSYELQVSSYKILVTVESLKARVEIRMCEFKFTSCQFSSTSYDYKYTSCEFKSTSYE